MDNYTIDADRFGATMQQILGDLAEQVNQGSGRAVRKAAKKGRDETEANAPELTGGYKEGWTYKVKKTPEGWVAEVGNKKKPGLAHLLEKGHARVGGGRVDPSPKGGHIGPAADKAFDELIEQVNAEVNAL